jgi:hypothetical protein
MATATTAAAPPKLQVSISAPNFKTVTLYITGTAPLVQRKFAEGSKAAIVERQVAGSTSNNKKKPRAPKDFEALYQGAMHRSREGWHGIPAAAFRAAMISACRIVGYKMTLAKLALFTHADGIEPDGTPLVRVYGTPHKYEAAVRINNGMSTDVAVRPMFDEWDAAVRISFDADMFTLTDVVNLMTRVGLQVGIGEGRPDSKTSCGQGWGTFTVSAEKPKKKVQ